MADVPVCPPLPWAWVAPVVVPLRGARPAPPAWHGRPEWLLQFGWPPPVGDADAPPVPPPRPVALIGLGGLSAASLMAFQLMPWGGPSFEMSGIDGLSERGATAGALLEAVSAAGGHRGLVLDLDYLGLQLRAGCFTLRLHLQAPSVEALSDVLVVASLR